MNALEVLIDVWKMYSGFSPLYFAVPVSLFLFLSDKNSKARKYVLLTAVLLLLLVFNPFVFALVTKIVDYSSYRMFWMFPSYAALAYIVYFLAVRIRKDALRLVFVVCFCAVLIFFSAVKPARSAGKPVIAMPSNKFQIDDHTVYLANEMLQIMDSRGIDSVYILSNQAFVYSLRQYNSRFLLHVAPRYLSDWDLEANAADPFYALTDQLTGKTPVMEPAEASEYLDEYEIYFIVVRNDRTESILYLEELGWNVAAGSSDYTVFCRE